VVVPHVRICGESRVRLNERKFFQSPRLTRLTKFTFVRNGLSTDHQMPARTLVKLVNVVPLS
jgi:hypothetical protein